MKKEHTVGSTGEEPVTFWVEGERCTGSYLPVVQAQLVERVFYKAKQERLAVVAYDVHHEAQDAGIIIPKIQAFCYHHVLPL